MISSDCYKSLQSNDELKNRAINHFINPVSLMATNNRPLRPLGTISRGFIIFGTF